MTGVVIEKEENSENQNVNIIFSEDLQRKGKVLVSGNEAITRGIIESGVEFASIYPGTPVTEVGDLLYSWSKLSQAKSFIFDYAINEIVALEEAIGASWTGLRSVVIFKHLGMNIASDALHSIMYSGIGGKDGGGMVIICGGDPQSSSSTNSMDVRMYSLHTKLPILFPSSTQELHKFVKLGYELSESIDLPVMIYTTPKLNFATGIIFPELIQPTQIKPSQKGINNDQKETVKIPYFRRDMNRYINAIHFAINNQKKLLDKISRLEGAEFRNIDQEKTHLILTLEKINEFGMSGSKSETIQSSSSDLKNKKSKKRTDFAIITGGLPFFLTAEIISKLNLSSKIAVLKINIVYPINQSVILNFIQKHNPKKIMIVEELEPLIENSVKNILYDNGIHIPIVGKNIFPRYGELSPEIIQNAVEKMAGIEKYDGFKKFDMEFDIFKKRIPIREPTFCPGCSHRNVFYALRKVADKLKEKKDIDLLFGGDIGCYTMGMSSPYSAMDWLISMGAGIGVANGIGRVFKKFGINNQRIVALIGDSTFFHSGIQGLLNILKENLNITVIILNNYYVAMTGHQPTFTTPPPLISNDTKLPDPNIGFQNKQLKLDEFLRNLGAYQVVSINGYKIPEMITLFENSTEENNQSKSRTKVIVVDSECALMVKRNIRKIWELPRGIQRGPEYYVQISSACPQCDECYVKLGCTAIKYVLNEDNRGVYLIDDSLCLREKCNACIDVCPNACIEKILINPNLNKIVEN
ncbi:MAG: thiamine pyrophosphate-dependent enzyme [Promethearchaeota archaeon]